MIRAGLTAYCSQIWGARALLKRARPQAVWFGIISKPNEHALEKRILPPVGTRFSVLTVRPIRPRLTYARAGSGFPDEPDVAATQRNHLHQVIENSRELMEVELEQDAKVYHRAVAAVDAAARRDDIDGFQFWTLQKLNKDRDTRSVRH